MKLPKKKQTTKKTDSAVPDWAKGPYRGLYYQYQLGWLQGRKDLLMHLLTVTSKGGAFYALWHAYFSELYGQVDKKEKDLK